MLGEPLVRVNFVHTMAARQTETEQALLPDGKIAQDAFRKCLATIWAERQLSSHIRSKAVLCLRARS